MGIHRVDEVAARKQPVPRPLPGPVDVLDRTTPDPAPDRKRAKHSPRHWRRRLGRFVKSKRGRWTLLGIACVLALLIGLLAEGYFSSPAPAVSAPQQTLSPGVSPLTPDPSPSSSPSKNGGKNGNGQLVQDPVGALRNGFPDNPLNHLNTAGLHSVTISAQSGSKIPVLGFLVPTGLGPAYGSLNGHTRSWSVHEQALGRGYLAAIFIQAGRAGTPITCTVTVDGKVTSSETTSGPYGRAVCLG